MNVRINGKEEALAEGLITIEKLVQDKGLIPERIVVEVNLEVISRENWSKVNLRDDDQIEIVSFVGGG
ncbi:MAG: Sulfur carrier protein ThiS [Syntrophus sp. PtaB.Bin001]|nr:MAG: Sulfur carrier protein ThiS [Syntrophus sp. PtaB.Bin001]